MIKNFLVVIAVLLFIAGCGTTGLFASYDKTGKHPLVTVEKLGESLKAVKPGDILVLVDNNPKTKKPVRENKYSIVELSFVGERAIVTVQEKNKLSFSIVQAKLGEHLANGGNIYFVRK